MFRSCHELATGASHNLRGHVLGLVGLGNIGQHVAAKLGCGAFGMRVHYFDVVRKPADVEAELGATFHETLAELLAVSDCAVLCAPASPDERPLVTREALAVAKKGFRFVNVARGSLVDDEALADALDDGTLSAAALDVHSAEPRIDPRLLALSSASSGRVMITRHDAG